jgi:NAD+ kinase
MNMKIAIYIGAERLRSDERLSLLVSGLQAGGCEVYMVEMDETLKEGTEMLLSVGGDGTFLSAAIIALENSIPVVGVNMGRMGFLSEGRPEDIVAEILSGEYTIESRAVLEAEVISDVNGEALMPPYAVNEMTIRRSGAAMLGIDVCVDGVKLPTYWGDGLVISTSSGSTAYSLSVGGPIVLPESKVLIISPIAPHNLNVRPLVVPDTSEIVLSTCSRDGHFELSADNRTIYVPETTKVVVKMAQFSLKRVRLNKSNFIQALTDKLYWGEDVRNIR